MFHVNPGASLEKLAGLRIELTLDIMPCSGNLIDFDFSYYTKGFNYDKHFFCSRTSNRFW